MLYRRYNCVVDPEEGTAKLLSNKLKIFFTSAFKQYIFPSQFLHLELVLPDKVMCSKFSFLTFALSKQRHCFRILGAFQP